MRALQVAVTEQCTFPDIRLLVDLGAQLTYHIHLTQGSQLMPSLNTRQKVKPIYCSLH